MKFRISNKDKLHHAHVHQGMHHHGPEAGEPDGRYRWRIVEVRSQTRQPDYASSNYEVTRALSPVQGWETEEEAEADLRDLLDSMGAKYEEVDPHE